MQFNSSFLQKFSFYTTLIFIIKVIICTYFSHQGFNTHNYFVIPQLAGDTNSYYGSMEHFISKGFYSPFYRMPGTALPYFLFRFFFSIKTTYVLIIYSQILLDSIATYLLALTISSLINIRYIFQFVLIVLTFNTYHTIFDIWLTSDSFATSYLVISVCFFYLSLKNNFNYKFTCLSGLFIMWCIFCRPIYIGVLLILASLYLYHAIKRKQNLWSITKLLTLFLCPFFIADSFWIYFGYQHKNQLIPLEHNKFLIKGDAKQLEAYNFPKWKITLTEFVQSFGGDVVDWNPEAEIYWFETNTNLKLKGKFEKLPEYAFCSYYNQDSMLEIKNLLHIVLNNPLSTNNKDSLEEIIVYKLNRYTEAYKSENKFSYYIGSRIIILKHILFQNPTYNLYQKPFSYLNIFEKCIKLFYYLIYYLYFLGFAILLILLLYFRNQRIFAPMILVVFYGLTIYPYLRLCEYRYIVPIMPFITALSVLPFVYLINHLLYGKNTLFRFKQTTSASES